MHSHSKVPDVTGNGLIHDMLGRQSVTSLNHKRALWIFGSLFLVGVLGFILRAVGDGFTDRQPWGYFAATVAFLLTTAGSAPLVAVGLRMVKAHWRRPLSRIAELYSATGVLIFVMFLPLLLLVPSAAGRRTLWFQDTDPQTLGIGSVGKIPGAPHVWVTLAIATLVIGGLCLLWLSSRPDMALLRDMGTGRVRSWGKRLSGGWHGGRKQWKVLQIGLGLLGGFFFIVLIGTHSLFSIDFVMALVPGWRDSIFPLFQALNGLQAGLATTILTLFFVRRYGGLDRYIHMEHFWGASKILLALSLLWFYFWFSGFIIFWYGRAPIEQNLLELLMFGPYRAFFFLAFCLSFLAPFLTLLWNSVRKTTWGPALASAFILVGAFMDKLRLYVPSYSIREDIKSHALEIVPPVHYPDIFDIMMITGSVSGVIFIFMITARIIPILSLWEMIEGIKLRTVRKFMRTELTVLGKPE